MHKFVALRKTAAIFMLILFLFANTELHELLRLPVLVQHYLEHRTLNHDESFADFLAEHYSNEHGKSNGKEHHDLPFKSDDCSASHIATAFTLPAQTFISSIAIIQEKIITDYSDMYYPIAFKSNIWQPPKFS